MKKRAIGGGLAIALWGTAGFAQMPVFDFAAVMQAITQLEQMRSQLKQMQETHSSFNKLTNMGDIAAVLNRPDIRQAMPKDYEAVRKALLGNDAAAQQRYDQNTLYASASPANSAYDAEIERQKRVTAGTQSVGQGLYDAASKRQAGIEELRRQIGQSEDPKTTMDLQARIAAESLAAQNELTRIQAFKMLADAEERVDLAKQREAALQKIDDRIRARSGQ